MQHETSARCRASRSTKQSTSTSEAILKNGGKIDRYQTATKHNKMLTGCLTQEMYLTCKYLSSTWREFDSNTACVVCISISLGFPYVVFISPIFPNMVSIFTCFPYTVMLSKHLDMKAIVLDTALLWTLYCPKNHYCNATMIWPLLFHGICAGWAEAYPWENKWSR